MTVAMLLGFSVMTRTYSCACLLDMALWSTGSSRRPDGVVLNVNATCAQLGSTVCSQLLGAHVITGGDTVSYPFGKDKASMLNTLKEGTFRCNGLRVYAVCGCNKVRLPGTGQSAHVIGGSRFTRPASNSRRTLLN